MRILAQPRQRSFHSLAIILMGVSIFIGRLIASKVIPVYDDAFITWRMASNLASGSGLVYNVGEAVLGTTSSGFAILAALVHLADIPVSPTIVVFNALLDASLFLLTVLVLSKTVQHSAFALVFGMMWGCSPIVTRISVGGMESNLFLLLSVCSIVLYWKGFQRYSRIASEVGWMVLSS